LACPTAGKLLKSGGGHLILDARNSIAIFRRGENTVKDENVLEGEANWKGREHARPNFELALRARLSIWSGTRLGQVK
jgi:hypothetical protein